MFGGEVAEVIGLLPWKVYASWQAALHGTVLNQSWVQIVGGIICTDQFAALLVGRVARTIISITPFDFATIVATNQRTNGVELWKVNGDIHGKATSHLGTRLQHTSQSTDTLPIFIRGSTSEIIHSYSANLTRHGTKKAISIAVTETLRFKRQIGDNVPLTIEDSKIA